MRPLEIKKIACGYFSFFLAFLCSILAAIRGPVVSERNDTEAYRRYFECLSNHTSNDCLEVSVIGQLEPGSDLFFVFMARILDFQAFQFVLAFFVFFPVIYFVLRFGKMTPVLILLLLSSAKYWELAFNVVRQGMATSLFFIALTALLSSGKVLSKTIFLAPLFHNSAVGLVPIYWFKRIESSKRLIAASVLFMVVSLVVSEVLMEYIANYSEKIAWYLSNNSKDTSAAEIPIYFYAPILIAIIGLLFGRTWLGDTELFFILYFLISLSFLFSTIGIGYRFLLYSYPIFVVVISRIFYDIGRTFQTESRFIFRYLGGCFLLIFALMVFFNERSLIYIHFGISD